MKSCGIVWRADVLRARIADNRSVVPGTRMRHVGVVDKQEQDILLGYLKSLV